VNDRPPPSPRAAGLRRVAAAALIAAAIAVGCSERERSNPLDPKNSATGGKITGFMALAGNRQVEIRWTRLPQADVAVYLLQRWRDGEAPQYIGDAYGKTIAGVVDSAVVNDETYHYRLVAFFTSGDSAVSPEDVATPGTRKIAVLSAGVPALVGLTPDARKVLFIQPVSEAYEDMELDRVHTVLWLTAPDAGFIVRSYFDGRLAGPTIAHPHPSDVSVSNNRGIGWVAFPDQHVVRAYDLASVDTFTTISSGEARVVEAGTNDPTVWIGNDSGFVRRFTTGRVLRNEWTLGSPVVAIALDEVVEQAWVAVRTATGDELYILNGRDSTATKVGTRWSGIADLAFDATTGSLWVSERGVPRAGNGRLTRLSRTGAVLASLGSIEPFGIMVDPVTGNLWASEVSTDRIIEVSPDGAILRGSAGINVPYAVRVVGGPGVP
jgi:DNA-binding beta-propeller fold protein YncE